MSSTLEQSITIRLPEELIEEVNAESKEQMLKKSEIVRRALRDYYARRREQKAANDADGE